MLNFENTFLDGLSAGGRISGSGELNERGTFRAKAKAKAKAKAPKKAGGAFGNLTRAVTRGIRPRGTIGGHFRAKANASGQAKALLSRAHAIIAAKPATATPNVIAAARIITSAQAHAPTITPVGFSAANILLRAAPLTNAVSPAIKAAAANIVEKAHVEGVKSPERAGVKVASDIVQKTVRKMALKAPKLHAQPAHAELKKAHAAVAPIAHACKCHPKHVVAKVDKDLCGKGYPQGAAIGLLASVHDMNAALERAALQRLATYEHKRLTRKADFEREVLQKLAVLAGKLPTCHPARTRAHLTILKGTQ